MQVVDENYSLKVKLPYCSFNTYHQFSVYRLHVPNRVISLVDFIFSQTRLKFT